MSAREHRTQELSASQSARAQRHAPYLPLLFTSFVGREAALRGSRAAPARIPAAYADRAGGGVGKTRLALEVAHRSARAHGGLVGLVELATLASPNLIPRAIADVLGVIEQPGARS